MTKQSSIGWRHTSHHYGSPSHHQYQDAGFPSWGFGHAPQLSCSVDSDPDQPIFADLPVAGSRQAFGHPAELFGASAAEVARQRPGGRSPANPHRCAGPLGQEDSWRKGQGAGDGAPPSFPLHPLGSLRWIPRCQQVRDLSGERWTTQTNVGGLGSAPLSYEIWSFSLLRQWPCEFSTSSPLMFSASP